jgi:rubrerythrin
MPYKQVRDILSRAVEFHGFLKDFYKGIEDMSEKDSVKLLVDYMARHEKSLQEFMEKISEAQDEKIKDEWVKYEPDFASCKCFDELKIDKTSGVDDVIDAGLNLNQCLIDLYHHMAEIGPTEEIKELFSSLETEEIAEKKKLARMRGM